MLTKYIITIDKIISIEIILSFLLGYCFVFKRFIIPIIIKLKKNIDVSIKAIIVTFIELTYYLRRRPLH